ncbi:unnamed protein product [Durusdinium trenchii]|uniref:Uncharacterized protein n=1 Tax=Durusdinium trenchii TaxID=1381693 RepID=A0ABP0SZJ4_9DINO
MAIWGLPTRAPVVRCCAEPDYLRVRHRFQPRPWLPSCRGLRQAACAPALLAAAGARKSKMARMERVVFLGTGSAVPVPGQRNMSSLAVMLNTGGIILVDCGEGTQHHIKVSTLLKLSRVEVILLTHLHGDHCFGLFGVLSTAAIEGRKDPILIVGPQGIQDMVESMLRFTGGWAPEESFNIEYLEIPNTGAGGEDLVGPSGSGPKGLGFHPDRCRHAEAVELGMLAGLRITAVPLVHGIPDWGYILKELDRPGKLDAAKAQKLGIPRNSLMGRLKQGEAVTLDDGRVVLPEQVLGPEIPGRSFAVLQDTSDASSAIKACHHANCVIHEATFEAAMEEDALRKGHSTSVMAARFTAACEAKRLILSHFSARYAKTSDVRPGCQRGPG